jgi:hypothetical protein
MFTIIADGQGNSSDTTSKSTVAAVTPTTIRQTQYGYDKVVAAKVHWGPKGSTSQRI